MSTVARRGREGSVERTADDREVLEAICAVLHAAAEGDLEQRVLAEDGDEMLMRTADRLNHLLDVVDGFIRESGATLVAASQGTYYRRFLAQGMPGSFRAGAADIDGARREMDEAARALATQEATRKELAAEAVDIAAQVAAASTELSASAESLSSAVDDAVSMAGEALSTVEALESAGGQIQQAVTFIGRIATQTRVLALNAQIEAARAGEAGKGFAVVANEVKSLADETTSALTDITAQIDATQEAAGSAARAITTITGVIDDIDGQSKAVALAAGGQGGLSHLAETLNVGLGRAD